MNIQKLKDYLDTRLKLLNIEFDEDEHTYKCDGEFYTGVTKICRVNSLPWLHLWTTKENYRYMEENWDIEKEYGKKEKEALLKEAKDAHKTKSKKAQKTGKKIHGWVEKHIRKENPDFIEKHKKTLESFLTWEKMTAEVKWIKSEMIIGSKQHKFAGTLDALGVVKGKLALIDFKTSKRVSKSAFLQTAGYQICLEELGLKPKKRLIVRLPKNGDPVEVTEVPTPLDFDKETFLRFREAHRWNLLADKKVKEL